MKATIAVLCVLVAVAYTIVVEARMKSHPIDNGPLDPKCVKPRECPGTSQTVSYYNPEAGCQLIQLGANCTDNGNYKTLGECNKHCLPAPGTPSRLG
uniref:Putative secreted protein n=1 Tax=Ixodes scapularis TaxID=6945 RepID=Q8MVD1_IXOSC|nr:putative secreted protein [Ixodes scapularis]